MSSVNNSSNQFFLYDIEIDKLFFLLVKLVQLVVTRLMGLLCTDTIRKYSERTGGKKSIAGKRGSEE